MLRVPNLLSSCSSFVRRYSGGRVGYFLSCPQPWRYSELMSYHRPVNPVARLLIDRDGSIDRSVEFSALPPSFRNPPSHPHTSTPRLPTNHQIEPLYPHEASVGEPKSSLRVLIYAAVLGLQVSRARRGGEVRSASLGGLFSPPISHPLPFSRSVFSARGSRSALPGLRLSCGA